MLNLICSLRVLVTEDLCNKFTLFPLINYFLVASDAICIFSWTNFAATILKRPRSPPANNPAMDYQTADSDHVLKRSRPFGISDEVCNQYSIGLGGYWLYFEKFPANLFVYAFFFS